MELGPTRVEVFADGRVTVGGEAISPPDGIDPYSAAIAVLADYAKASGAPVLADAIDHVKGQQGRFHVHQDGRAEAVNGFPGTAGSPAAPSRPPVVAAAANTAYGSSHLETQFVRPDKPRPTSGIRGALYSATGGLLNLGPSAKDQNEAELERRIARPLSGSFNTAILSLKGGIGKTSTTVGVGMILAEYRGDHPCAIDANPDSGDLAERALGEMLYQKVKPRTITDIVRDIDQINSLTMLTDYMHHANRLHLVAGEQDPALSDALTAEEYLKIKKLVSQYYSVTLTDCGTGVSHPAMAGVLPEATNLVIASGYAVSGAKRARNTLQWLADHGYENLARNAIVVVTDKDQVSSRVNKRAIEEHLAGFCRQLITVPHDRGVADGDRISLDKIAASTRRAYKEIAAGIVDGYV
ncbi:MinD/ParA family protein [Paenarthrobacter sp. NPDC057981]|uniref:MinD/ParA family ATP-binding protein n=1 Tax=Paenarthrobacter sp. NPDC057981 TaxID=3346297 RepID=UPI0036D98BE0